MTERKRREVREIAHVAHDAGNPSRNGDAHGRSQGRGPQRRQVLTERAQDTAAELDLAPLPRVTLLGQHGYGLAQIANIQRGRAADSVRGHEIHGPAGDVAKPGGPKTAVAIE